MPEDWEGEGQGEGDGEVERHASCFGLISIQAWLILTVKLKAVFKRYILWVIGLISSTSH